MAVKSVIVALVVGCLAAVIVFMRQPPAPPEEQMPEAQTSPAAAPAAPATQPAVALADGDRHTTQSGLTIIDIKAGGGADAKTGDRVFVHYTGRLYYGGKKFDSSLDRGSPYDFVLGDEHIIRGWNEGIVGMKVGGKRQLLIPPQLAYGDLGAGQGIIPPGATLLFDVELMKVVSPQ